MSKLDSAQNNLSVAKDRAKRQLRGLIETRVHREIEGKESSYPEDTIARIEANLREFQSESTGLAFEDLMAFMREETGSLTALYHEDDIFRSKKIDAQALWALYGVMLYVGEEPEDAARYAYIYYYHFCEEDEEARQFTDWPEVYRQNQLKDAIEAFDWGKWHRWRWREYEDGYDPDEHRPWTDPEKDGVPSDICHNLALAVIDIGYSSHDPDYIAHELYEVDIPTSSDVIESLINGECTSMTSTSFHKITPVSNSGPNRDLRYLPKKLIMETLLEIDSRGEETFEKVLKNLRDAGMVKVAEITQGQDYRIYPVWVPDPMEAERIWFEGEEHEPEPDTERETEPELMTDGGEAVDDDGEQSIDKRELREAFVQPDDVEGLAQYLAVDVERVDCPEHGEMNSLLPIIERSGRIFVPPDGVELHYCPPCAQQLTNDTGERPKGSVASKALWFEYVADNWDTIRRFWIDLGEGETTEEGFTIQSHESLVAHKVPDYLHEGVKWRTGEDD